MSPRAAVALITIKVVFGASLVVGFGTEPASTPSVIDHSAPSAHGAIVAGIAAGKAALR